MAQLYFTPEDLELGAAGVPDYLVPIDGIVSLEIVEAQSDDDGALGGKVLRYECSLTQAILVDALPETNGDVHIITRLRHADRASGHLCRPRQVDTNDSTGVLYEYRAADDGFDFRERAPSLTTIATGPRDVIPRPAVNVYTYELKYVASENRLMGVIWNGDLSDRPEGWQLDTTNGTIDTSLMSKVAFGGFSDWSRIHWFGIGTDGDPAPTGPVDDQPTRRRASPLLWTPF